MNLHPITACRGRLAVGLPLLTTLALGCAGPASSPAAASQQIGPEGATLALAMGAARNASIEVPPGALAAPVTITMREGTLSTPLPDAAAAGPVVVFGPEGQTFATPVTIVIPTTAPADVMYTRPITGGEWHRVPDAAYDAARGAIVAHVAHFSEFVPGRTDPDAGTRPPPDPDASTPPPPDASTPPDAGRTWPPPPEPGSPCYATSECPSGQLCAALSGWSPPTDTFYFSDFDGYLTRGTGRCRAPCTPGGASTCGAGAVCGLVVDAMTGDPRPGVGVCYTPSP